MIILFIESKRVLNTNNGVEVALVESPSNSASYSYEIMKEESEKIGEDTVRSRVQAAGGGAFLGAAGRRETRNFQIFSRKKTDIMTILFPAKRLAMGLNSSYLRQRTSVLTFRPDIMTWQ